MSDSQNAFSKQIHELRKPLNRISMQAELIKLLIDDTSQKEQVLEAAAKIITNAKACSEQLQALYDSNDSDIQPCVEPDTKPNNNSNVET